MSYRLLLGFNHVKREASSSGQRRVASCTNKRVTFRGVAQAPYVARRTTDRGARTLPPKRVFVRSLALGFLRRLIVAREEGGPLREARGRRGGEKGFYACATFLSLARIWGLMGARAPFGDFASSLEVFGLKP